ncbi:hypothetical protein [Sulfitobacter profundi]|uniref:Uncharacterized protein n=1 Tax=Sulfitobacter profundi TaxID=2679961 RepID=A0ABW1Z183_9RHOB
MMLILVAGMSIAAYLAYNVWDRIQALDSAQQDHAEWVFTQIEIEFLKTDRALAQAKSATPEALKEFRKRFDIFYSRVLLAERMRNNAKAKPKIANCASCWMGSYRRLMALTSNWPQRLMISIRCCAASRMSRVRLP